MTMTETITGLRDNEELSLSSKKNQLDKQFHNVFGLYLFSFLSYCHSETAKDCAYS